MLMTEKACDTGRKVFYDWSRADNTTEYPGDVDIDDLVMLTEHDVASLCNSLNENNEHPDTVDETVSRALSDSESEGGAQCPVFLQKLRHIISCGSYDEMIHWTRNGTAFRVVNHIRLAKEVFPPVFKHCHWPAFVHQLKCYGFSRVDGEKFVFGHKRFLANNPELTKTITRKRNYLQGKKQKKEETSKTTSEETVKEGEPQEKKKEPFWSSFSKYLTTTSEYQKETMHSTAILTERFVQMQSSVLMTQTYLSNVEDRTSTLENIVARFAKRAHEVVAQQKAASDEVVHQQPTKRRRQASSR